MLGLSIFWDFSIPHGTTAVPLNRQCFNQHSSAAVGIPLRSFGIAQVAPSAGAAVQSQFWGCLQSRTQAGMYRSCLGSGQPLLNLGVMEWRGSVGGQLKDVWQSLLNKRDPDQPENCHKPGGWAGSQRLRLCTQGSEYQNQQNVEVSVFPLNVYFNIYTRTRHSCDGGITEPALSS